MVDVDIGLIVVACIIPVLLIFFNLVVMAHYIDPQAAAGHFIGKLIILLGMLMAECTVLLLPFDVGNRSGVIGCGFWNSDCGGLNLVTVWQIAYCIIAGLVVVVIPFFIFYYENDDEGMEAREKGEGSMLAGATLRFAAFKRSLCSAIVYTTISLVLGVIAFFVAHTYGGHTRIPYKLISVSVGTTTFAPTSSLFSLNCGAGLACPCGMAGGCKSAASTLTMEVTYIIYLAALMSVIGWVFFTMYTGIGFVALPMDCFNAFIHRPKMLSVSEARAQRRVLMKKSEELIKIGEEMASRMIDANDSARNKGERRKNAKVAKSEINRFKLLVDMLESDLEAFQLGDPQNYRQHYNPFVPYFKLVGGVFSVILTLAWLCQIIVYMLFYPPLHPFINQYLGYFDGFFPLFGTLTIGVFGLYLLLAASKGAAKFGTRFFLISVHPLEPHKTLLNSFMFNLQLVLMCVLPTIQFCTDAFSAYARYTDAEVIFGSQFKYIDGFRYLWQTNAFLFGILAFTLLSIIYFAIFPSDRKHLNDVMAKIKATKATELKQFERKLNQQGGALSMV